MEEVPVVWAGWRGDWEKVKMVRVGGEHPAVVVYRASGIQFPVYCAGPISAVCCALRPL